MSGWGSERDGRVAVDFTALPPAAGNSGRVIRCNPLVAGQGYFFMVSDDVFWRPYGGEQKLYALAAPVDMALNTSQQLIFSLPIPPKMIVDGRTYIKVVLALDKLPTSSKLDTCTTSFRIGEFGTVADTVMAFTTLIAGNTSGGNTFQFNRVGAASVRRHGAAGSGATNSLSSLSSTDRPAAITVANMDTATNYITLFAQMAAGTTEYGSIHALTVELQG